MDAMVKFCTLLLLLIANAEHNAFCIIILEHIEAQRMRARYLF